MALDLPTTLLAALDQTLPTAADLNDLVISEDWRRGHLPLKDGRVAAPFAFEWRDGVLEKATFEIYDQTTTLGVISAQAYRAFLKHPESADTRWLVLGNVACIDFGNSQLLGDAIKFLAHEGLPPHLERLHLVRIGPVTNASDLGYCETTRLSPLLTKLGNLKELEVARCVSLGKLDLPQLRSLRLHSEVYVKNLVELARAQLPMLERLELECDVYSSPEERFKAMRALLRSRRLPRLSHLILDDLDLDEDGRLELEDDEAAEAEPDSWVDMIADSYLLRQLQTLDLSFCDDTREWPSLITRADDFRHLAILTFWGPRGKMSLSFPTRESIQEALER
jgi:hypothetical protein